jgi:hypothetical protein
MSAYQITSGPYGNVVDRLLDETAALNTSFSNRGFQEFLSNNCYQRPPSFQTPAFPFVSLAATPKPPPVKVWAQMDNPFEYMDELRYNRPAWPATCRT